MSSKPHYQTRRALLTSAAALAFIAGMGSALTGSERFDHVVRNDFFAAFSGNREALDRAMKKTEAVLTADPNHAEALVWHGSGLYFLAGEAFRNNDPQKGMDLYLRGLKEMDRAVELAPDHIGVRIPRGAVLLASTRALRDPNRERPLVEKGLSDYEHAFELQKDELATMGTHPRGELLFGLAEGHARLGNKEKAAFYFDLVDKHVPNTVYAERSAYWRANGKLTLDKTGCVGCHTPGK